jgi:hypothetical protein
LTRAQATSKLNVLRVYATAIGARFFEMSIQAVIDYWAVLWSWQMMAKSKELIDRSLFHIKQSC